MRLAIFFLLIVSMVVEVVNGNTLTFLYENEFNSSTSLAACRNSIDRILETNLGFNNYWTFSGKSLNNFGDMESCQLVAGGQYMTVEVSGDLYDTYLFSKAGKGFFYQNYTGFIGICIPNNCQQDELAILKPYFHEQASLFGFVNKTINIEFVIQNSMNNFNVANFGTPFMLVLAGIFIISIFIFFGTIIELTQIGNRRDVLVIADTNLVNSLNYKDVNRKILFEKEWWTLILISFSFIRNNLHILFKKRSKGFLVRSSSRKTRKLLNNLAIFDGIKSIASFQVCYALAFISSYYCVIQYPDEAKEIYNTFSYVVLVEGSFDVVKIFFVISGFLQAFSFLCKYGHSPTWTNVFSFMFRRVVKILPTYIFCVTYIIFAQ
jgi:hypothetical protein